MFQRKLRRALSRELGSIGQSGLNIRFLNRRVAANDFFVRDEALLFKGGDFGLTDVQVAL